VDLLLYAGDDERGSSQAFAQLIAQLKSGELDRALIEQSRERIIALKERLTG
jgi:hypothetical protein